MKKIITMIKKYIQTPGSYSIRQLRRKRRQRRAHRVSAPNPNEDQDCLLQQWGWGRSTQRFLGSTRDRQRGNRRQTTRAKGQFPGRLPVPLGLSPRWPAMLPPKEGWRGWCLPDGNQKPTAGGDAPREPPPLPQEQYRRFLRLSVSCRSARPFPRSVFLPREQHGWNER